MKSVPHCHSIYLHAIFKTAVWRTVFDSVPVYEYCTRMESFHLLVD